MNRTAIALLVAANMLPIFGVLLWDWNVFAILFLFWCENVVLGVFGIAKTAVFARQFHKAGGLFLAAFFTVHYGGFMLGHLTVLTKLFSESRNMAVSVREVLDFWTWIAIGALVVSHGWSFVTNFLANKEFESLSSLGAMAMPYKRMVITHVALIAGGFLLIELNEPLAGLLLLLGMKIALDITFHRRERNQRIVTDREAKETE